MCVHTPGVCTSACVLVALSWLRQGCVSYAVARSTGNIFTFRLFASPLKAVESRHTIREKVHWINMWQLKERTKSLKIFFPSRIWRRRRHRCRCCCCCLVTEMWQFSRMKKREERKKWKKQWFDAQERTRQRYACRYASVSPWRMEYMFPYSDIEYLHNM